MDLEVKTKEEPIFFEETSNTLHCEIDQKIEIKEETFWPEGTASPSFISIIPDYFIDNYKIISEEMHLKEELKSELAEPRETQPSTNIKDEICVDEHPVGQLVTSFKEEDRFGNVALLTGVSEGSCNSSCNILEIGSEVTCILPTHNECNLDDLHDLKQSPIHPIRQRAFSCIECGSKFFHKSNLRRHMIIHTGQRPHSCHQCSKTFARKSHLRQHLLTHTGERPHCCKICGKKFSQMTTLRGHVRTHTGERPHSCKTCGRKFSQRSHLREHQHRHTGERRFSCHQCDNKFSHRWQLRLHHFTHTGTHPYSCETCTRKFSQKVHLREHMRTHTGERPFVCDECDKKFF